MCWRLCADAPHAQGLSRPCKRIASFSLLVILALLSLPFHLETGYVSVDDSELFYYFIESQGNPSQDPIFLWLTGGPGCSAFNGLIYEMGPMQFDIHNYPGGLPSLLPWEDAWTKVRANHSITQSVFLGKFYF
uniref:Uncharacterized protein n=1 Tax=Kalanchoe fedtschenkoi TaxID=63787 RepID=A0A7N0TX67_KALFE